MKSIRNPLPGCTCKECRRRKQRVSMEPEHLTRARNRGNRAHQYGALWRCKTCQNKPWTLLSQEAWTRLAKRYPKRVVKAKYVDLKQVKRDDGVIKGGVLI